MNKLLLVVSVLFMGLSLQATEPVLKGNKSEKMFTISLTEFTGNVDITIFNWKGENVFDNEFSVEGIDSKTFDASALPDGKYTIVVKDNVKEKETPFLIRKGKIDLGFSESKMTYNAGIQQFENLVYVNALTGADNSVRILVENSDNRVVFKQTYDANVTFGKIFDLSELPRGLYVVRVAYNDKDFAKTVEIN